MGSHCKIQLFGVPENFHDKKTYNAHFKSMHFNIYLNKIFLNVTSIIEHLENRGKHKKTKNHLYHLQQGLISFPTLKKTNKPHTQKNTESDQASQSNY